jgi:hypothetical protein
VSHPDQVIAAPSLESHAARFVDMAPHVATLRRLAKGSRRAVEFGVRTGVSTWALLDAIAARGTLDSWDIEDVRDRVPDRVRDDPRWTLHVGDSLTATVPAAPDIVFIDTSHTYRQTIDELRLCASWGAPLIVLHDWNLEPVSSAVSEFCDRTGYRLDGVEASPWGMAWVRG